jgi:hypothetical protein
LYPYNLAQNPYPSSPTPTLIDARILGGKTHKDAKTAVLSCLDDLYSKISETATDKDFRLITVIQDVGSGKTHLALHIRGLETLSDKTVISYIDLSQVSPRNMNSLYTAMLGGFNDEYINEIRKSVIDFLRQKAEKNIKEAKKIFNYGFFDSVMGRSIADKAKQVIEKAMVPNYSAKFSS